jgi:hypothetical protein
MTDLADPPLLRIPSSPRAVRVTRRRWRDVRLPLGILLLLVSMLLGARVLSSSNRTVDLVAAARPLSAGDVLTGGDLRVIAVHLPADTLTGYWPAAQEANLLGRELNGPLQTGALVEREQIASPGPAVAVREVSVPVDPTRLADVAAGGRVDVYATYRTASGTGGDTVAVAADVVYLGTGGSSSTGDVAVELQVPLADTGPLVHASELGALDVVAVAPDTSGLSESASGGS